MPDWITRAFRGDEKAADRGRTVEGFKDSGAVVVRDSRGTMRAELPSSEKGATLGDDPLAIYKPDGAKHVSAAKALGNFTGWSYAAVNAIAREVAHIQWRLYKIDSKKDHIEVDGHELLDLLDGVNENMTGIELRYTTAAHLELTGNCYWLLDGVKTDTDLPKAIYVLSPGRMRVKLNKSTFPYKLSHYEYTQDGKVYTFQPHQMLHLRYPDPSDPFVGVGIPQTIPTWIDSDNYAMEYNRKFFLNGAQIGLYVQSDTNVEGQIERIKRGMRDNYAGNENAHKIPVMPKGVKLEHTGSTQKDMDFSKLAETTRDRILAGYGVSKTILGTAESDTNRATAETADYVFSKRTIRPKLLLILSYLNEHLVPRYGDDLYLTFIDPVPEDKAARTTEMSTAVGGAPVMTPNEARKNFMGLGPIQGGDSLFAPSSLVPVGSTPDLEGEVAAPQLARTIDGYETTANRVRVGGKSAFSSNRKMRSALTAAFEKALDKVEYVTKSVADMTHAEYAEHYKRFSDRTTKAEKQLKDVFQGINAKQRAEVIANLPTATGVKAVGDVFDPEEWMQITVDLSTPILSGLAADEAAAAFSMIGVDGGNILADAGAAATLDAGIAKMAKSYTQTTLDQIKQALADKLDQEGGTNLAELTQAVDDVYAFADDRRAGLIAKTESFRAANWANKEAWQQSGVVKTVKWYTAEDDRVCEFCHEQDGKEIPVDQNFYDAGATITAGDATMAADYGAIGAPPLHPDCRCYIRPGDISI